MLDYSEIVTKRLILQLLVKILHHSTFVISLSMYVLYVDQRSFIFNCKHY